MKYGFLGLGNMANAIIHGMRASGKFKTDEIRGYDVSKAAVAEANSKFGVIVCDDELDVANNSDTIILAVKPQVLADVLQRIAGCELSNKTIISIAAGRNIEFIEKHIGNSAAIIRVMPNINAFVGAATAAYTSNNSVNDESKSIVEDVFSTVGTITYMPEKLFSTFTALCGSSPAFVYMFIDAMAKAAVQGGMPRDLAQKLAADVVMGSAKMVLESNTHPIELCDRVCSPAGTTIDGVLSLQNNGFESAVAQGIKAVIDKDKSM